MSVITPEVSLAALERMLTVRRRELDRLHKVRQKLQDKLAKIDEQISALSGAGAYPSGTRARNAVNLVEAITAVVKDARGPLRVGDIMEKVMAGGYQSTSANFRGLVNLTLLKHKQFRNVGRGLYQLKRK